MNSAHSAATLWHALVGGFEMRRQTELNKYFAGKGVGVVWGGWFNGDMVANWCASDNLHI